MWRSEQRTFYVGSLRAKLISNVTLANQNEFSFSPHNLIIGIEDSAFQFKGCTKHGKCCMQNNQLPSDEKDELY
jgi:hypothetical protein